MKDSNESLLPELLTWQLSIIEIIQLLIYVEYH
jgi:hypothetical protein